MNFLFQQKTKQTKKLGNKMQVEYLHVDPENKNLSDVVKDLSRPFLLISRELLKRPKTNSLYSGNVIYFDSGEDPFEATITDGFVRPDFEGINRITAALNGLFTMHGGPNRPNLLTICGYGSENFYHSWDRVIEPIANFSYSDFKAKTRQR